MKNDLRTKRAAFLCALAIIAACVLLYWPSWTNPFVLDDVAKIESNPDMPLPFSFRHFFYPYAENSGEARNDPSRPLTYMVYWLCWRAGSGGPYPFHVVSTLFHALAALLVGGLTALAARRLIGGQALLAGLAAALLFLSAPLVAGTVIYVYGLSDVLSTVLALGALLLLVRRPDPGAASQASATFLFVLGLAAKQSVVVLPLLVVAWDLFMGGPGGWKKRIRVYVPPVLVVLAYIGANALVFGRIGDLEGGEAVHRTGSYAGMQGAMILEYLKLLFVPTRLTIDHLPVPAAYAPWLRVAAWAVVGLASVVALRAGLRRDSNPLLRLFGLGWSIYLIVLLPTSSLLPTVDLLVERRAYFAAVGAFLVLGGFLWHIGRRSRGGRIALLAAAAAAVLVQSAATSHRITVYGSPETLWREALARNPMNRRALTNLGTYYTRVERWDDAIAAFETILSHDPDDGSVCTKLAYIYANPAYPGRDDPKAIAYFDRGLALNPRNHLGHFNKAIVLIRMERFAEAEDLLRRAVALSPNFVPAHFMLGEMALRAGRTEEALAQYREVLRLNPGDAAATGRLREIAGR